MELVKSVFCRGRTPNGWAKTQHGGKQDKYKEVSSAPKAVNWHCQTELQHQQTQAAYWRPQGAAQSDSGVKRSIRTQRHQHNAVTIIHLWPPPKLPPIKNCGNNLLLPNCHPAFILGLRILKKTEPKKRQQPMKTTTATAAPDGPIGKTAKACS